MTIDAGEVFPFNLESIKELYHLIKDTTDLLFLDTIFEIFKIKKSDETHAKHLLLAIFPVLIITDEKDSVVINISNPHQDMLLLINSYFQNDKSSYNEAENNEGLRGGSIPMIERYRMILEYIKECLEANSSVAAQERRRNNINYSYELKLDEIKHYVIQKLKENVGNILISKTTIRRLMLPPHCGRIASKMYRNMINAKIFDIENNDFLDHSDEYYCNTQLKYALGFASLFDTTSLVISCYDKAKVKIGVPSINKYMHNRRFTLAEYKTHFPDHDFAVSSGMLITPSGYLILNPKNETKLNNRNTPVFIKPIIN
jgi:hypothetical protein